MECENEWWKMPYQHTHSDTDKKNFVYMVETKLISLSLSQRLNSFTEICLAFLTFHTVYAKKKKDSF